MLEQFCNKNCIANGDEVGYKGEEGEKDRFIYKNNPMDNPKAAKDIIENPNAVYGYSPKPGSSLDEFIKDFDWSDKQKVENARLQRIEYHKKLENELKHNIDKLLNEGKSVEEVARIFVRERNKQRAETYIQSGNLNGLEILKARNMKEYQNPDGPTAEQLFDKYGSWEKIIYSSIRSNPGMDACTGLYDIYGGK